jgi:hypothetical protein
MGRFAYGWKPSPPHKVGLGHPEHLRAMAPLPDTIMLPTPPCLDQGNAGSCVGNSVASALQAAAGEPWGALPARRFIYAMARARAGENPLTDDGAEIAEAFAALAEVGYPPESVMPYTDDPILINERPNFEALHEAIDQAPLVLTGAYRLASTGEQRVLDVRAALAARRYVVWGTYLDQAFEGLGASDVWPGVVGKILGGHAMYFHGYAPWKSGFKFPSRSSWQDTFGDGGSGWVSEDAIASSDSSDYWVAEFAPKLPEVIA